MFLPLTGVLDWIDNLNGRKPNSNPKVVRVRLEQGLIVHSWRLAPRHSLWKRYFGPALTTLVLGLGLGLGFHLSCWFNLERQLVEETEKRLVRILYVTIYPLLSITWASMWRRLWTWLPSRSQPWLLWRYPINHQLPWKHHRRYPLCWRHGVHAMCQQHSNERWRSCGCGSKCPWRVTRQPSLIGQLRLALKS